MKKMKTFFIVLAAAAAVLAVGIMFLRRNAKIHILDGPGMVYTREGELTGLCFTRSGKDGEYCMYRLTQQPDGAVLMEYEYRTSQEADVTADSKLLQEGSLDPFREICRRTECMLWAHEGVPGDEAPDGKVTEIVFYLDEEEIKLTSNCNYSGTINSVFDHVYKQLQLLEQDEK